MTIARPILEIRQFVSQFIRRAVAGGLLLLVAGHAGALAAHHPVRTIKPRAASARQVKGKTASTRSKAAAKGKAAVKGRASARTSSRPSPAEAERNAAAAAQASRLNSAFTASAQLRPMAQQLASTRSAASYAGVQAYAAGHPGAGAFAASLALGHAYSLDRRYPEAAASFHNAADPSDPLADYADYLGGQALLQANRPADAVPLLDRFADRHPGSIFTVSAPVLLAGAYVQQGNAHAAVQMLEPLLLTSDGDRVSLKLALAKAYQAAGDTTRAAALDRAIYTGYPLSPEARDARAQLSSMGQAPSAAERKVHADQMFNAKRYGEAAIEYQSVRNDPGLSEADRDGLQIYAAVCQLKLKHLSRRDVDNLPATNDDTAALKQYLYAEISRTEKDRAGHDAVINDMVARFPQSRWTEEALYSGGNMYLLTHDATQAIYHYNLLVQHFPNSIYAPSSHWRAAWMNYRLRRYDEAARLMDEQVVRYGAGIEAPSALYWRGRIFEEHARDFPQAANYYRTLSANYPNYYYGILARQRLLVLGRQPEVAPSVTLASTRKLAAPNLSEAVPPDDPHYIKAKLLANAALNEYIAPEIQASPGAAQWGSLAQAEIYASFGETTRALQAIKHSGISFFALPIADIPAGYWHLMFPQPYWSDLVADSNRNGLDPYLVASLIRQESEFNAGAVSPAHAYGLMQLLPSVGKENARREGMKGFDAAQLLNPSVNLALGTRNLKGVLDRFGGQPEYALAAYNAGDVPIRQWLAAGDYQDVPEFVESIPYSETREYVQAILRNRELYRALYAGH